MVVRNVKNKLLLVYEYVCQWLFVWLSCTPIKIAKLTVSAVHMKYLAWLIDTAPSSHDKDLFSTRDGDYGFVMLKVLLLEP